MAKKFDAVAAGWTFIEDCLDKNVSVVSGMNGLLDLCNRAKPSKVWDEVRTMNLHADQAHLTAWLNSLLAAEPPPEEITGLWFGLFNPCDASGRASADMYLAGSERFTPEDCDGDWACSPEYFPNGRYSGSRFLDAMYSACASAGQDQLGLGDYLLTFGYSALTVAEWCRSDLRRQMLGTAPFRGVEVGFDSGDSQLIAVLKPT